MFMVPEDPVSEPLLGPISPPPSSKEFIADPLKSSSENKYDVYDHQTASRTISLAGIGVSILFSIFCIASGIYIAVSKHDIYTTVLPPYWPQADTSTLTLFSSMVPILPNSPSVEPELLGLLLNLAVTFCTESAGFVHAVALRSALADEFRLQFNTNIRLLTASQANNPWTNPNSTLFNGIMAILLIMSYISSSFVFLSFQAIIFTDQYQKKSDGRQWNSTCIFAAPVIILGVMLLLQVVIALAGLRKVRIFTWSTSPLDVTAALLHKGKITPVPGRCMCNILPVGTNYSPQLPSESQPSAWKAHPNIKRIVIALWAITIACVGWGGLVYSMWHGDSSSTTNWLTPGLDSWAFFPNSRSNSYTFGPSYDTYIPGTSWVMCYVILLVVQGVLTFGLHCSEMIVNVVRDEAVWRAATTKAGAKAPISSPISGLRSWPNLLLLAAKPVLHWMFGLSISMKGTIATTADVLDQAQTQLQMSMHTVQIWYLAMGLGLFSIACTIVAMLPSHGPQPVAYGHIQTLANLVDEWSPTMWWGHKGDGPLTSHAGTSDHPLPPVKMDCRYAGT